MATIASVCQEWTEKFRGVDIKFRTDGIPSPEETAKRIIAHALGKEKVSITETSSCSLYYEYFLFGMQVSNVRLNDES